MGPMHYLLATSLNYTYCYCNTETETLAVWDSLRPGRSVLVVVLVNDVPDVVRTDPYNSS